MGSQNQLKLLPTIFVVSVFLLSSSPYVIAIQKPQTMCKGVPNKQFCLQVLSNPKAEGAKDDVQLTDAVMKLGASKCKETLNHIEEMLKEQKDPKAQQSLKICMEVYESAIKAFGMVPEEVEEDPETANYDVQVIGPEVDRCSDALKKGNIDPKQLQTANKHVETYASLGAEITEQIEN